MSHWVLGSLHSISLKPGRSLARAGLRIAILAALAVGAATPAYALDETCEKDPFAALLEQASATQLPELPPQLRSSVALPPHILAYSNSAEVDRMIDAAIENTGRVLPDGRTHKSRLWTQGRYKMINGRKPWERLPAYPAKENRSTKNCFRYVKVALIRGGLVGDAGDSGDSGDDSSDYLAGGQAKSAGGSLKAAGFVNLLDDKSLRKAFKSPYDAPRGAILVYTTTDRTPNGHIEVKVGPRGQGGFVSDYFTVNARTGAPQKGFSGRGRRLIGIYVKDQSKLEVAKNDRATR